MVDFSLVESPGKNVGYTDVGGDCPIFYMSNEMFVELYNNPAIMSYVFDVEKEHFLPATEYINSLPTVDVYKRQAVADMDSTVAPVKKNESTCLNVIFINPPFGSCYFP